MASPGGFEDCLSNHETTTNADATVKQHEPSYELHKAVFHGHQQRVKELLEGGANPNVQDKHGNSPLHIAVMLGHKGLAQDLLKQGALVKEKNCLGWTPLDEAISYGDRAVITLLLKKLRDQTTEGLMKRRQELIKSLQNLGDFYAELKWEFHTWVPFLSRLLPSDICKIYKTGSCIRLDSTLGDFTEMRWTRGDLSFIFNGEDNRATKTLSMVVLDNRTKEYQRMRLLGSEDVDTDIHEHVNMLINRPVTYANMSTQPIEVTRAQSGWFFRVDKTERVGEFETDVYHLTNLILVARRRREHLTPEQIQQQEEISQKVERGEIVEDDLLNFQEGVGSIPPPPSCNITWEEYIHAPEENPPHLGRQMDVKIERKHYRASVCMADRCPVEIVKLLDILEVLVPYKHFHKLRQFVHMKLPPGFPVKLDIPVFPTVAAIVTLQRYESRQSPTATFLIPRDYKKFVPKKQNGEQAHGNNSSGATNS